MQISSCILVQSSAKITKHLHRFHRLRISCSISPRLLPILFVQDNRHDASRLPPRAAALSQLHKFALHASAPQPPIAGTQKGALGDKMCLGGHYFQSAIAARALANVLDLSSSPLPLVHFRACLRDGQYIRHPTKDLRHEFLCLATSLRTSRGKHHHACPILSPRCQGVIPYHPSVDTVFLAKRARNLPCGMRACV